MTILLPLQACGTTIDLLEDPSPYGGVANDIRLLGAAFSDDDNRGGMGQSIALGFAPFIILEVPICLALDTALLPLTFPLWLAREEEPAPEREGPTKKAIEEDP